MARLPRLARQPGSVDPRPAEVSGPVGVRAPNPHRESDPEPSGSAAFPWRRNLNALGIAQTLAIAGFSLRVPYLPFFLGDLGVESTDQQAIWSGLINAGGAGVMAITAPIWGMVSDRFGRKPMLLRAMFAATFTVALMGFATQAWHLLALRFLEGALTGTVTAATALVATTTPKERLGFSLGMIQTAVFSGAALGPLFGGVLADQIGYRPTFFVAGGMLALSGLIVLFVVEERFKPIVRAAGSRRSERGVRFGSASLSLFSGVLLTMTLVLLVVRFASSAVQPILPLYVAQLAGGTGGSSALAGLTLGVLGLTSALSAIVLGRLGDRIGHRSILLWCAIGSGIIYVPMALAVAPWQLVVLQALFGVAAGGLIPAANALVAGATPATSRGAIYGWLAAAAALGGFAGPLVGAALAATIGFRATFIVTAAILLLMALRVYQTRAGGTVPSPADISSGAVG